MILSPTFLRAGFLASIMSLPFVFGKANGEDKADRNLSQQTSTTLTLVELNSLRSLDKQIDKRQQETDWVEKTWPHVQPRAAALCEAEEEDNKLILEGKLDPKNRRVKTFVVDFVPPGEAGFDEGNGGLEGKVHIVKKFDYPLSNGGTHRVYFNEYWRLSPSTGRLLLSELIRIKAQIIDGDLTKPNAEDLFATDIIQIVWGDNYSGKKGINIQQYPYLWRQHLYGNIDPITRRNPYNQTEDGISAPRSCIKCHNPKSGLTEVLFPKIKRTNYGAIIPDEMFNLPPEEHPGYLKYRDYLLANPKRFNPTHSGANSPARVLLNHTNFGNPHLGRALREDNIPWFEGDKEIDQLYPKGYLASYWDGGKVWTKCGLNPEAYGKEISEWWSLMDFEISGR